jgi:hypothetical protein
MEPRALRGPPGTPAIPALAGSISVALTVDQATCGLMAGQELRAPMEPADRGAEAGEDRVMFSILIREAAVAAAEVEAAADSSAASVWVVEDRSAFSSSTRSSP